MVLMEAFDRQRKNLILILLKEIQNFVGVYIKMLKVVICLLMEMKFVILKLTIKVLAFQPDFVWKVYLMDSVIGLDYNSIDKSHILNIHKYLMRKNNEK